MKNAHERFGFAEFEKKLRDTSTRIRLTADCFIGERAERSAPSAGHLLSAFGTDVEVAALWAAILTEEPIRVGSQDLKPYMVQFGERPTVYRGTLTVPGRKRPVRHLVVVSTQLRAEGDQARIIVKSNSPCGPLQTCTACPCYPIGASGSPLDFRNLAVFGNCPA